MHVSKVSDLPHPVAAAKAHWLVASHWTGFTPVSGAPAAASRCQATIERQLAGGYLLEYITRDFGDPNPGHEADPAFLEEKRKHAEAAGRLVAVHRLLSTAHALRTIVGEAEFERIQDRWAQGGKRHRWSVAFPLVESYTIPTKPFAREVFGRAAMQRLFGHPSAILRPLSDDDRRMITDLPLSPQVTANAWIGIRSEIVAAEGSDIAGAFIREMDRDLGISAVEGFTDEQWTRIRRRAAWLAQKFARRRRDAGTLRCDRCGFDPVERLSGTAIKPRSVLDVHHRCPLEEGRRVTTLADLELLCPTCHRIEHLRRSSAAG